MEMLFALACLRRRRHFRAIFRSLGVSIIGFIIGGRDTVEHTAQEHRVIVLSAVYFLTFILQVAFLGIVINKDKAKGIAFG